MPSFIISPDARREAETVGGSLSEAELLTQEELFDAAVEMLRKAALQGHAEANYVLGMRYLVRCLSFTNSVPHVRESGRGQYRCGTCKQRGHNSRSCRMGDTVTV